MVMTDLRSLSSSYKNAQREMQQAFSDDKYMICEKAGDDNTVDFIARGIICISASPNALENDIRN